MNKTRRVWDGKQTQVFTLTNENRVSKHTQTLIFQLFIVLYKKRWSISIIHIGYGRLYGSCIKECQISFYILLRRLTFLVIMFLFFILILISFMVQAFYKLCRAYLTNRVFQIQRWFLPPTPFCVTGLSYTTSEVTIYACLT